MKLLLLILLAIFLCCSAQGQAPTVRFEHSNIFVSQRAGAVEIPVIMENSEQIPPGWSYYVRMFWNGNNGTALEGRDYSLPSILINAALRFYRNNNRMSISIPIHYTCSTVNKTFAVLITGTDGVASNIGSPSVLTVTILGDAAFIRANQAKLVKLRRLIRKARRIRNPTKRKRRVNRLSSRARAVNSLLCQ